MKLIANLAHIDRQAIDTLGIPGLVLMEEAGRQVAEAVSAHYRALGSKASIVIVCGRGNNGGDGFVCARHLAMAGIGPVTVLHTAPADQMKGDAQVNFKMLSAYPIARVPADPPAMIQDRIARADIVVDALFGSGLSKPVTGIEAELIEAMNRNPCILAVDLPSGIDGATGKILGTAVRARETITFATSKPGLHIYPGKAHAGRVRCVDIGIPQTLIEADDSPYSLMEESEARTFLPWRDPAGHKYTFGSVLVIAGSRAMPGAAVLSAEAVLRSGAGMATLAAPQSVFETISVMPEIVRRPLSETDTGTLCDASFEALSEVISSYDVIAVGPGIGQSPQTLSFMKRIFTALADFSGTVVLDADALNALSRLLSSEAPPSLSPRMILTPHGGEFKRLAEGLGLTISDNPLEAVRQLREKLDVQLVYKSGTPLAATHEGRIWINATGNSGMATAGSGDVLTGVIAGLLAQKVPPEKAAPLGMYLHGLAGDLAAEALTPYAMVAGDITQHLGKAFKRLQ